jgi:hypothetical protein
MNVPVAWFTRVAWAFGLTLVLFQPPLTAQASPATPAAAPSIDLSQAGRLFKEAQAISDKDGGALWGVRLYGATLLVDDATREVVANRPDYKDLLVLKGDVFVGTLPPQENASNTSMTWLGIQWTMLQWPLPEEPFERDKLIIHESFHRIQDQIGLGGPDTSNNHLDTRDGRIWMQLEWRALKAALLERGDSRRKAAQDALVFRARRRSLFKEAADHERALEIHEGLAEYTGVALCSKNPAEAAAYAAARLGWAPSLKTFVRSFAYVTGPAYGLLLDQANPAWRKKLTARDDLSDLLATALGWTLPADLDAASQAAAQRYGGKELTAAEEKLAVTKSQELASMKARFVDGPVLNLPLAEAFKYSFDPTNQVPLEGLGTVYPFLRISASWGILEANRGALLLTRDAEIIGARVSAPGEATARPLKGEGWTLELQKGWDVVPGKRPGDFDLKRTSLSPP